MRLLKDCPGKTLPRYLTFYGQSLWGAIYALDVLAVFNGNVVMNLADLLRQQLDPRGEIRRVAVQNGVRFKLRIVFDEDFEVSWGERYSKFCAL